MAACSCGLRFWQLSRFNNLVFDEVYFVRFAQNYLSAAPSFDAHPPLGKYFIAAGIWLHSRLIAIAPAAWPSSLASSSASFSWGYRWMNALAGSCVPLVVMGFAYTIGKQFGSEQSGCEQRDRLRTFAILSGLFVAIDGLFIVESRYGLINIYVVLLGLLGQWLWLLRSEAENRQKRIGLGVGAGVCLGGAIATKWNGLGFVLSLIVWSLWKRTLQRGAHRQRKARFFLVEDAPALVSFLFYIGLLSSATYAVAWLPHLWLTQESFLTIHSSLLSFHQRLASDGHSACSQWFTWPLLLKPIAYWYEEKNNLAHAVNNMGNPALWWLSSAAIVIIFLDRSIQLKNGLSSRLSNKLGKTRSPQRRQQHHASHHLTDFLLISYSTNWLPWLLVQRCTFIYLYMPAAVFSFMGLAWLISGWLQASASWIRLMGWVMFVVIVLAFLFWLPLSIGSPLSAEDLQLRWWLKSWI